MVTRWDPNECGRYWVVGGRYTDMSFETIAWSRAMGPFSTRYDAEACWRLTSFAFSHDAIVRFVIVEEPSHVSRAA